MGDADAFAALKIMVLVTKRNDAMPVLNRDRARGLEARRGEAREFVEEDAAVRVASAFGHELRLRLAAPPPVRYHHTTGLCPAEAKAG